MFRQLHLTGPGARLESIELDPPCPPGFERMVVLAAAPGPRDLAAATAACEGDTRCAPGEVVIGRSTDGSTWCCAGLLPCGRCPSCQASAQLACADAQRLGVDIDGGLADLVDLPAGTGFLAPLPGDTGAADAQDRVAMAALIASGGATYQAAAMVGMAPGDVVVLHGPVGPGALPLRVLVALGLRVTWLAPEGPEDPGALTADLADHVVVARGAPAPGDLPSSRIHLLDLAPPSRLPERFSDLAQISASLTLAGPGELGAELRLERMLQGQLALRRIRDLHPHLVLELAALALKGRVDARAWSEAVPLEAFPAAYTALVQGRAQRWPVLVPR